MMPKKSFGQHFLVNRGIIKKIINFIPQSDLFVEIGPGQGALTKKIVEVFNEQDLILVEADRDLIQDLKDKYPKSSVKFANAVSIDFDVVTQGKEWVLIGNLPYNASSAILENALKSQNKPQSCIVMVQKEQALRMMAEPGDMSVLSVAIQIYTNVKKLFDVSPGSFNPPPKVDSSVLRLDLKSKIPNTAEEIINLSKIGFSARRKQLRKNLSKSGKFERSQIEKILKELNLPLSARAQELSIDNWIALERSLKS